MILYEEFRQEMEDFIESAYDRPESLKEGIYLLIHTESRYERLDKNERLMTDRVLSEWLLSEQ
jgi:hypothetical protein